MDPSEEEILVRDCLGARPFRIKTQQITYEKWVAACLIAESMFGDFFVTAETALVRNGGMWELTFMIVKHSRAVGVPPVGMYRSSDARPYIPENRRPQVIELACDCLERLLSDFGSPRKIVRVLKEPQKRSLRLHDEITGVLSRWGYDKTSLSDETAHYVWVHERS